MKYHCVIKHNEEDNKHSQTTEEGETRTEHCTAKNVNAMVKRKVFEKRKNESYRSPQTNISNRQ